MSSIGFGVTATGTNQQSQQLNFFSPLHYNAPPGPQLPHGYGTCPSGVMKARWSTSTAVLPTIEIRYEIQRGTQTPYHPSPGTRYSSLSRDAYLPIENGNYQEAYRLYIRLACAWLRGHSLTVGRSLTTGRMGVCWSQIVPHKTNVYGPQNMNHGCPFSLPDTGYSHQLDTALTHLGIPTDTNNCLQLVQQHFLNQPSSQAAAAAAAAATPLPPPVANGGSGGGFGFVPAAFSQPIGGPFVPPAPAVPPPPQPSAAIAPGDQQGPPLNPEYEPDQRFIVTGTVTYTYTAPRTIQLTEHNIFESYTPHSSEEVECPICFDDLRNSFDVVKTKKCGHLFHRQCIMTWLTGSAKSRCPSCTVPISSPQGPGPSGWMTVYVDRSTIFREGQYVGTSGSNGDPPVHPIVINYSLPSGVQAPYMDHPGQRYSGALRTAYLPNTQHGRRLLKRLQFAFMSGLSFKVGTSLTTGATNTVVWTSIHHKTSLRGGTHGYPDPDFLRRCGEELDALHVPKAEDCF
mmetsp:Transcript_7245/g.17653  ORF Transcript_7245/g.17653 Transcript_7245/m.17653 type:complete len:514 (-) Transcript_7245:328-1869(-)